MKRLLLILALLYGTAFATNAVYIANAAAGGNTGTDCADAKAASYFNTSGNWSSTPTGIQIGPGTTVHACGTFTGSAGAAILTFQGNGSSGNPVELLFEAGAGLSSPYCIGGGSGSGCLTLSNGSTPHHDLLVDGGTPCGWTYATGSEGTCNGTIVNTANGTSLANQQDSLAIMAQSCTNCEIRNVGIYNIFVQSSGGLTADPQNQNCVLFSGTNVSIHDSLMHDVGWCFFYASQNGDNNVNLYRNEVYNTPHPVFWSGVAGAATNGFIYSNHFHDYANWNTPSGLYHVEGIHTSTNGGSGVTFTGLYIYNNVFGPNEGINLNAQIYFSADGGTGSAGYVDNGAVFNNVCYLTQETSGQGGNCYQIGAGNGNVVYNNTALGATVSGSQPYGLTWSNISQNSGYTFDYKNNVIDGFYVMVQNDSASKEDASGAIVTGDYNVYGNCTDAGNCLSAWYCFSYPGNCNTNNWSLYQAAASPQEAHSVTTLSGSTCCSGSANINTATFKPNSGSLAIGAGKNLTALCMGNLAPLCSDAAGNARPTGLVAWDMGALNAASSTTVATPTFSLTTGTYAGAQVSTITTSTSGASIVYTADGTTPTVSGINCAVTNGNLAPNNYILPVSQSVTITAIGCLSGENASSTVSAAYTITYSTTLAASNFGMQCGFSNGACKNPTPPPLIRWPVSTAIPSVVRMLSSNTDWSSMQPNSSGIVYTDLDGYLDQLAVSALASVSPAAADEVFISVPCYLATAPTPCPTASQPAHGTNSPPADLTATGSPSFNAFVTAFVNHCSVAGNCVANLIKYYEMWNEPNLSYSWAGTELQLEQMIAPAAQIIAANVPNAIILTPSFSTSGACPGSRCYTSWATTWLAFENTVGPFSSWVLMHDYLGTTTPESHGQFSTFATAVHGVSGWSNALLANDETNWAGSNGFKCVGYSTADCIGQIVRWQILHDSNGYAGVWWFSWNGSIGNGPVGYATAYYYAEQYLTRGHFTSAASGTGTPPVWTAPFVEGNGKTALWVWTTSESGTTYTVPSGYTDYRDISGGSTPVTPTQSIAISVQPIMLEQGGSVLPPATVNASIALLAQN